MEPIINPMFFYWVGLCGNLVIFSGVVTSVLGIAILILILVPVLGYDELAEGTIKTCWRWVKLLVLPMVLSALTCVLLPSGRTLTKMVVAKNITPDNLTALQSLVGDAKDSLKADILEIVQAVNEKKDGN